MRAALYARVSTLGQEPENQLAELRRYAAARGWEISEYVDHGVSGSEDRRRALDALVGLVRAWPPPHKPAGVIAEAADVVRPYRISSVQGDRYAAEFVTGAFRNQGIAYMPSPKDTSTLYLELLPLVQSGRVRLLDQTELLRELRGLERRRGAAGRDRIGHPSSAHDDRANACAGAVVAASRPPPPPGFISRCLTAGQGVRFERPRR